jgi:hypothetical protein
MLTHLWSVDLGTRVSSRISFQETSTITQTQAIDTLFGASVYPKAFIFLCLILGCLMCFFNTFFKLFAESQDFSS